MLILPWVGIGEFNLRQTPGVAPLNHTQNAW